MYLTKDTTVGFMWPVTTAGLWSVSQPWFPAVFFLLLRIRRLAAAALYWATRGCPLSRFSSAGWRTVSQAGCFHFGLLGAARPAAAVVAAMFAPAWAGTLGPRFHEDHCAVILWAEVRTVWRAVVRTWSGKLDLKIGRQENKSGVEEVECVGRAVACQ